MGLPGCAFGVTVPTSMKPKPISSSSGIRWPFLSNPAAKPILLPTLSPFIAWFVWELNLYALENNFKYKCERLWTNSGGRRNRNVLSSL